MIINMNIYSFIILTGYALLVKRQAGFVERGKKARLFMISLNKTLSKHLCSLEIFLSFGE